MIEIEKIREAFKILKEKDPIRLECLYENTKKGKQMKNRYNGGLDSFEGVYSFWWVGGNEFNNHITNNDIEIELKGRSETLEKIKYSTQ